MNNINSFTPSNLKNLKNIEKLLIDSRTKMNEPISDIRIPKSSELRQASNPLDHFQSPDQMRPPSLNFG